MKLIDLIRSAFRRQRIRHTVAPTYLSLGLALIVTGYAYSSEVSDASDLQQPMSSEQLAEPGLVAYRQSLMRIATAHLSAMGRILRGEVDRPDQLAVHASGLVDVATSSENLYPLQLFLPEASQASEMIWSRPDAWQAAVSDWQAQSRGLAEAIAEVESGSGLAGPQSTEDWSRVARQYQRLAKSCQQCHQQFSRLLH